jgi:hypothetical protein
VIEPRTRIAAIVGTVLLLAFIVELVRRRRLKEEYSVLWVLTALALLVLSIWYGLLLEITSLIGAVLPSSTLFLCGLIFALALLLHFSVRVSQLERQVTLLVQELGLLRVLDPQEEADKPPPEPGPRAQLR